MIAESPIFVSNLCVISADRGGNPDLQLPQRPCTRGFAMQQSNSVLGRRFPWGVEGEDRLF